MERNERCIPQGSALGPLLFLIYMNDLPSQVTDRLIVQYADDTTLICSGATPSLAAISMNTQLQLLHKWITNSKMILNLEKSSVMWFRVGSKQSSEFPSISVNDCTLKSVQRQKYLGVVFDCTLSWTYHVSQVCKKMSYYLYLIGRHKHCLDAGLIKLLSDALVLSHLPYSLLVWGPAQQSLHRLECMQNWAVQMTMGLSMFLSIISNSIGYLLKSLFNSNLVF